MMSLKFSDEELDSLNQLKELARSLFPNPDLPPVEQVVIQYDFDFRGEDLIGKALYSNLKTNTGAEPIQTWKARHGSAKPGMFLRCDPSGTSLQYTTYKEQREDGWRYYSDVQLLNPVNPGETFEVLSKAFMGGEPVWWEAEHHRILVRKGMPPAEFRTSVGVSKDSHWLYEWILPQKARLLDFTPKPVRIFAEKNRLHLIFHFCTVDEHEEFEHFLQYLLE